MLRAADRAGATGARLRWVAALAVAAAALALGVARAAAAVPIASLGNFDRPVYVTSPRPARRQVLVSPRPGASYHSGGTIAFSPAGYRCAGTGDGGTNGAASRSTSSLLGKILRIDPRPGVALTPPGNPFGNPVWSIGLR